LAGWGEAPLDVALTERGEREAIRAAELLDEHGMLPDVAHTSVLSRAIRTLDIGLAVMDRLRIPTRRTWRLNERHYGALQGRSKAAVRAEVGDHEFTRWRRSYDTAPPPLDARDPASARHDPRYAAMPARELPSAEALADVLRRVVPYWQDVIAADLALGRVPLVVVHGNSLRSLCMHLDQLSADEVAVLHIPTGVPLRYDPDPDGSPLVRGGTYLDPAAAAAGAAEVAAQGGKRKPPAAQGIPLRKSKPSATEPSLPFRCSCCTPSAARKDHTVLLLVLMFRVAQVKAGTARGSSPPGRSASKCLTPRTRQRLPGRPASRNDAGRPGTTRRYACGDR
jgi:2,3-bisphosphoglycerate-dependent phosphoglycerate mutase